MKLFERIFKRKKKMPDEVKPKEIVITEFEYKGWQIVPLMQYIKNEDIKQVFCRVINHETEKAFLLSRDIDGSFVEIDGGLQSLTEQAKVMIDVIEDMKKHYQRHANEVIYKYLSYDRHVIEKGDFYE